MSEINWMSFLFVVFSLFSITFAALTVFSKRVLRAAIFLTAVLVFTAAFYVLLGMHFLAGVQILVYVGGIIILIVFAIMLTSGVDLVEQATSKIRLLVGVVSSVAFFALTSFVINNSSFETILGTRPENDVKAIGLQLLDPGANGYIVPFEVISLLLLAVFVGGIVVARSERGAK